jgi:transposase
MRRVFTKINMNTSNISINMATLLEILLSNTVAKKQKLRALVVMLWAVGISYELIIKISGVCKKTARNYVKNYKARGEKWLNEVNFYRPRSELEGFTKEIINDLEKNPCATINQCKKRIEELTGLKRSPTQIRNFLDKHGFKHLKAGQFPSKADPEKQKEFLEKELEPRLEEARQNKRVVLFGDAAHFVMGAFLANLWCRVRVFVGASCGRKRYNVLGALNPFSQEIVTVTNSAYINADSVCELLGKIYHKYSHLGVAMTLVLDNAKYQKCEKVRLEAEKLGIELLYLTTYSPNLNLIERLWRFVKKDCLYSKHYEKFEDFINAIDCCLEKVETEHKNDIKNLITTNFQDFSKIKKLEIAA